MVNIPEHVKLKVWTEAAGRCQFRGCNKPLWYNALTLNGAKFGEMAHIIGASEDGPRGNKRSEELAKNPDNIILLCGKDHKEVDNKLLRYLYPDDVLIEMKKEHTERVRMLLDQPSKKTTPLLLKSSIGDQNSIFGERSIRQAILPDYPDRIPDEWVKIDLKYLNKENIGDWKSNLRNIDNEIDQLNRAILNDNINHLSIFGLASQPFLIYLGYKLGDKIPTEVYEPKREADQDKWWVWDREDGNQKNFRSKTVSKGEQKRAILLIEVSDYIKEDKYVKLTHNNPYIYSLYTDKPTQGSITKKSEKQSFRNECRYLLNQIQKEVGKNAEVLVMPAMPASFAIEFGRLIQPTKDPVIRIFEYTNHEPMEIVKLNSD